MFRMAIAAVALIGMLTSSARSFAADLLGDEHHYDRSYYDRPYQPEHAIPAPRADIYGRTLAPPPYAPPEARWSCERPPYGTGAPRPLVGTYDWAPPSHPPSYWQPDYRRSYGTLPDERGGAIPGPQVGIPRPQVGIYGGAPTAPDTYARPDYQRSYDLYANCGINRYWNGQRCVDARYAPRYPGRRL